MTDPFAGPVLPDLGPADVERATLNDDLMALAKQKRHRDAAKTLFDTANAEYRAMRDAAYQRMEDEKVESVRVDGQLFVRNKPTWYATIQDRATFQAWAKQNAPALLVTKEAEAELNKTVRACIDDGRPFPPGLSAYPDKIVAVRK